MSRRGTVQAEKTAREMHIEANYEKLKAWKDDFVERNGRSATKADMLLADPEISALARRLGETF